MSSNESTFNVNVTAISDNTYAGTFRMRRRLSFFQEFRKDELRRELLGVKPESAPPDLQRYAFMLSVCSAHIIDSPDWWRNASNGVDLLDGEPVDAVFAEISKVLAETEKALLEKKEKAKATLKDA
jgi:hypothetical protein